MSASYSFSRSVRDSNLLSDYVLNTFPSLVSCTYDGTVVRLAFSPALTVAEQTTLATLVSAYPDPNTIEDLTRSNLSVFNTTSALLGANGVYTGNWEDVSRYGSLRVSIASNVESAASGLALQFGLTKLQTDIVRLYTIATATDNTQSTAVLGRYFRVVYTNGATAQASFSLATYWSQDMIVPVVQSAAPVFDQNDCALSRSLVNGRSDGALGYFSMRIDEQDQLRIRSPSNFERQLSAESVPIIQVTFIYNVNSDCTISSVVAGGTVTQSLGRALVSTAAAINSRATLSTDRYCRCGAGNTITAVVSCSFTAGRVGSSQWVGVGNAENGLFFGYNGTAWGVATRTGSVTTFIPQTAFNIDRIDGTGASGVTLDPTKGNTYVLTYDATGYGTVVFMVLSPISVTTPNVNMAECVYMHRVSFANVVDTVGIVNPQFPMTCIVTNTTNATAMVCRVASFSAFADGPPRRALLQRFLEASKAVSLTVFSPAITILNKPTFNGITNTASVHLREISISCTGGTRNMIVGVYQDATLGSMGTYTDVSTANSVVSYSVSATGTITAGTGIPLYANSCYGSNATFDVTEHDIMLSPGSTLCIAVKSGSGGTTNINIAVIYSEFQ